MAESSFSNEGDIGGSGSLAAGEVSKDHVCFVPPEGATNLKILTRVYITGHQANSENESLIGEILFFFAVASDGSVLTGGVEEDLLTNTTVGGDNPAEITSEVVSGECVVRVTSPGGVGADALDYSLQMRSFVQKVGVVTPACFIAGTSVQTPVGPIAIERLNKDDTIWAYSHERGRVVESHVLDTHIHESKAIWALAVEGGETLHVTQEHPFWVPHRNDYVPVGALEPGMELLTALGQRRVVVGVSAMSETRTVYNIKVSDQHNYFVGEQGILVHNK